MAEGGVRRFFAPIGLVLLIVGIAVAALAFIFILLDLSGDFPDRVRTLTAFTSVPFILGGAALAWMGR